MLRLDGLAFTGKRFQDVRTALNRAKKSGVTAEWIEYPHAPLSLTDQVNAISEEWVADKGLPEMGFTLGGIDRARRPAGALPESRSTRTAACTASPAGCRCTATARGRLDAGLHAPARATASGRRHGVPDRLGGAALQGGGRGVRQPVRGAAGEGRRPRRRRRRRTGGASTPRARGLRRGDGPGPRRAGPDLEPVYGFRSLLAFKSKFQPEYVADVHDLPPTRRRCRASATRSAGRTCRTSRWGRVSGWCAP